MTIILPINKSIILMIAAFLDPKVINYLIGFTVKNNSYNIKNRT